MHPPFPSESEGLGVSSCSTPIHWGTRLFLLDSFPERSDSGQAVTLPFTGNHPDSGQLSAGAHTPARSRLDGRLVVSGQALHHMDLHRAGLQHVRRGGALVGAHARAVARGMSLQSSSQCASFMASALRAASSSSRWAFGALFAFSDLNGDATDRAARIVIADVETAGVPANCAVFETRLPLETNR